MDKIMIVGETSKGMQADASALAEQGYRIIFDIPGEHILDCVRAKKVNLVIMSCSHLGRDEIFLCELLKNDDKLRNVPVILLADQAGTESIAQAFDLGAADYLTKPYARTELLVRVRRHLLFGNQYRELEQKLVERTEALAAMLQIREQLTAEYEVKMKENILNRVFPLVQTLRETLTVPRHKECIESLATGLGEMLSDFSSKLVASGAELTAAENQVAGLIREGRTSKQIADQLSIAENTVVFHRQNIRKKLGLTGTSKGLRTVLKSFG
ncbi:MAG: LuxR C-terminal-related transcriptional regulator [Candidatus Electrothrix sp.]